MCKNGWSGPEYNHLDREQYGKLEDSIDIKPGGTCDSRYQKRNLSRRLIIAITVRDHYVPLSLIHKRYKTLDTGTKQLVTNSRIKDARSISLWMT